MIIGITKMFNCLYKQGVIDNETVVVISGNRGLLDNFSGKECENVYDILVNKYGYDRKLFVLEKEANNIFENLLFSKKIIDDFSKYNNILVMGAAFALRRIKMCAGRLDYPLDKLQFVGTVDKDGINCGKDNWWQSEAAKLRVYQELERI